MKACEDLGHALPDPGVARPRSDCRGCGGHSLLPVFDLGDLPLVNNLADTQAEALAAPRYPLALTFCSACFLVQLTHDIPPEKLFSNYSYFSSYSQTMLQHSAALVASLSAERQLGPNDLVVEVASNDGYLLQYYKQRGIPVLGIEPATNVAEVARERGIETLNRFFGDELARELSSQGVRGAVVHAHNTLAHVPDLQGFLKGLHIIVADHGTICIEVPHVLTLVTSAAFDTVYHEHYSYFSLTTLDKLTRQHGLTIVRAEETAVHGGSLRIHAMRSETAVKPEDSVARILAKEVAFGIDNPRTYQALASKADQARSSLLELIAREKLSGRTLAAYGASAKGCITQNFAALTAEEIPFVVDKSPHKQGKFVPGTGQPILPTAELASRMPALTLLTVWNLKDEVLGQELDYRQRGGRFVVPIPTVEVLQ